MQRFSNKDLTDDAFWRGRVRLWQPKSGYRAATDPVFLAASCRSRKGDRVLDVGAGAGAASVLLGRRMPGLRLEGVEVCEEYAALSRRNMARNGLGWRVHVGDFREKALFARPVGYDVVITNPPFFDANAGFASPNARKDIAHRETARLDEWLDFCLRRLKSRGWLTMIHRAERLDEILAALCGRAGDIAIAPLWPRRGLDAKRVIVRARKDSKGPLRLTPGFIVHNDEDDRFTDQANAVLAEGATLDF